MVQPIRINVGRQRVTKVVSPAEATYIQQMRQQSKGIVENYRKVVAQIERLSPEIIEDALAPAFRLSQRYVPVKSGRLKASGYLESGEVNGIPVVEIGYAKGGNPPYAVPVHEKQEVRHAPPTRAKFLQEALQQTNNIVQRRLFEGYRDLIGG